MAAPRSTLQIIQYLHKDPARQRSNSIVEITGEQGRIARYIRDYNENVGSGSYGEVYRLKLENDPVQTILAKKEKPKSDGSYHEGDAMLLEAKNWVVTKSFGGFCGSPYSKHEPHIVIMPDLAGKTISALKNIKYDSTNDFLLSMVLILDKLDDFHAEFDLVHYDLTENNILFDPTNRKVEFVDLGLARQVGERVHRSVCDKSCHSGDSSGYFPPELNPAKSDKLDTAAKVEHDTYIVGRLLSKMFDRFAIDRSGKKLAFLPAIEKSFNAIVKDMQAPLEARIELTDAVNRLAKLARLNALLENQDRLSVPTVEISKMAERLLKTLDDPAVELPLLAEDFSLENRDAFLNLFTKNVSLKEEASVTISPQRR